MNRRDRRGAAKTSQTASTAVPVTAASLHDTGLRALKSGQFAEALEWIAQAVRSDPKPDYLASLGSALQQLGRRDEALKAIDTAIQLKPDDAGLWHRLGQLLLDMQRYDEALLSFQHVLQLDARHQDAAYKCGVLLNATGRFEEALTHIELSDRLLPNRAPTLKVRAGILYNLKRFEAALTDNERANKLDPGNADTCNNIGACLKWLGREKEALPWFERALTGLPDAIEILNNKALCLSQLQRFDEAFTLYGQIKARGLNNATTDWNEALLKMLTGDFEAGWTGRESSCRITRPQSYPVFDRPRWSGEEPIDGKTLLVHVDEGLGDTIQFARYLPMLAAQGARIVLVAERPLQPLLAGLPSVAQCLPYPADSLPPFDLHCPMGSLPLIFKTRLDTIPSAASYLPPPDEKLRLGWDNRLGAHDRLRVGLVWSGNPSHQNDVHRSMSFEQLSRLFDVDAIFISLQKDPRPADKALLAQSGVVDWTGYLTDFAETAALIGCLDLVITVDTSVAHLAGALGCPTWIMLPWTPDYRWLLHRDDSPWYPTVRLFRQTATRDYGEVVERLRAELLARVSAGKQAL